MDKAFSVPNYQPRKPTPIIHGIDDQSTRCRTQELEHPLIDLSPHHQTSSPLFYASGPRQPHFMAMPPQSLKGTLLRNHTLAHQQGQHPWLIIVSRMQFPTPRRSIPRPPTHLRWPLPSSRTQFDRCHQLSGRLFRTTPQPVHNSTSCSPAPSPPQRLYCVAGCSPIRTTLAHLSNHTSKR